MSVPQPPRSRLQIAVCTTKLGVPCTAAIDGNVPCGDGRARQGGKERTGANRLLPALPRAQVRARVLPQLPP